MGPWTTAGVSQLDVDLMSSADCWLIDLATPGENSLRLSGTEDACGKDALDDTIRKAPGEVYIADRTSRAMVVRTKLQSISPTEARAHL